MGNAASAASAESFANVASLKNVTKDKEPTPLPAQLRAITPAYKSRMSPLTATLSCGVSATTIDPCARRVVDVPVLELLDDKCTRVFEVGVGLAAAVYFKRSPYTGLENTANWLKVIV